MTDTAVTTEHTLDTGMTYVLDHTAKEVLHKTVEAGPAPDGGEKLRKTGGDYDQFVAKLPAVELAKVQAAIAPPAPKTKSSA